MRRRVVALVTVVLAVLAVAPAGADTIEIDKDDPTAICVYSEVVFRPVIRQRGFCVDVWHND